MKYIKLFEKWGINQEVEDSAKYYLKVMSKPPLKSKYTFIYSCDNVNYTFDIIIKKFKNEKQKGEFSYYMKNTTSDDTCDYTIQLSKRDDYNTLIHELKHFDRHIRKGINKDILSKGTLVIDKLNKISGNTAQIFYLFNIDEFEARYHGYYTDIDTFLSKNLKENPSNKDVIDMINYYLNIEETDKTYKLWKIDFNIDILKNSSKKELIRIFNGILDNKPLLPMINFNDLKTTFNSLMNFIKSEIGMEVTPENFDRLVKKLNHKLNRNRENFGKKFKKLYTIMVDKYVK